jgi:uncharacterized protein YndB with AHSA1/START domain
MQGHLKLKSSKTFNVPASDLWIVIHEPGNMPAWNSKCVSASHTNGGGLGSKFDASFTMGTTVEHAVGEVVAWEFEREIKFRYVYESESKENTSVEETYLITALGNNVSKLDHVVDLSNSGLPWWVKTLASFLNRFGRSVGPGPLEGIEELLRPGK